MKSGWVTATAAVFVIVGWAAAQAPVAPGPAPQLPPGLPDPYLTPAAPPGVTAAEPGAATGYAPSGGLAADCPDSWPPPYRVWGSADFLVWKLRNAHLPPLATQAVGVVLVNTQTLVTAAGVMPIAVPESVSIVSIPTFAGGNSLNVGEQFGGRFTAGVWLDPQEYFGIEATGFFITPRSAGFGFNNSTTSAADQFVLNFPSTTTFVSTGPAAPPTPFLTVPNVVPGRSTTNVAGTSSAQLWGAELNARCASPSLGAVSGLIGFRYLDFRENLQDRDSTHLILSPAPGGNVSGLPPDLSFAAVDSIRAHNDFYGGQIGLDLDMYLGRFMADISGKSALGVMHQTVNVFGASVSNGTGTMLDGVVVPGGLLSSAVDNGSHSRNRIAFVQEINVKLGYQILPSLRAYVGYDFLYLSSVVRPGNQVGISGTSIQATVASTTQLITINEPAFRYSASDMTINGINFGAEFRY
jgi:hypothetical protein